jgi:hypothetical protein
MTAFLKKNGPVFLGLAGCLFLLAGCGLREVRFTVSHPNQVEVWGVKRLAVIDFTDPPGQPEAGQRFTRDLTRLLQPQGKAYTLIGPDTCRPVLQAAGLSPSLFQDAAVVSDMGRRLEGADALLFGDLQEAIVLHDEQTETVNRKIGERKEESREVMPDGREKTVTKVYPLMQGFWVKKIKRTVRVRVAARMVYCADNAILWQDQAQVEQVFKSEAREEGERKGDWRTDEILLEKGLQQAGRNLLHRVLPISYARIRNLAEPSAGDNYGKLIQQGNAAALSGRWGEANAKWRKARDLAPDRPEAVADQGVFKERSRDYAGALEDFTFAAQRLGAPWDAYAEDVKPFAGDKP